MFDLKLKNLFIVLCVFLSLFINVGVCYADVFIFPIQFEISIKEASEENIEHDAYIKKKADELGISKEEYKKYLFYRDYDESLYYTFNMDTGEDEKINDGFTYQEYEKYIQRDNVIIILSLIGLGLFIIFWIFILSIVVKKIKRQKLGIVCQGNNSSEEEVEVK